MNIKTLLPDLKNLVVELDEDLLARAQQDDKIDAGLRKAFQQVEKGRRTAQAFEVWREDYLDQVAVAWVLACVFVRFMEDNHLIDECWLAGEKERRKLAEDTHELFFRKHPHDTDREYFHHVFHEVGKIPAACELFAEGKTPLWAVAPSGDTAMKLLAFWREIDPETGHLKRSFEVEEGDTRFLGDLYQELSEKAKKKYALLQTPVFVEEFILDRTLNPAIDEFGLEKVRLIDPTCGSGHFLLGAFARLFRLWMKRESNEIVAAQKALDGVWGVDINPFAVAIARFRLIVAALQACGIKSLKRGHAPGWKIHLAAGDSLLFGSKPGYKGERVALHRQGELFEVPAIYAVEEAKAVDEILDEGYHVVVGNPPYIIARDRKQNAVYRALYSTCHQKYSLGVPFTQRFWELAIQQEEANSGCGYVGMITANSFMKREFGKKLIEEFFPKIDLTLVIDTSGAYIPGHGTPTVILYGRSRKAVGETVRAVMGIKGEPNTPADPSQGLVWQSILKQIDRAAAQDEFTSTADVSRSTFNNHPWGIGGGGAADLKEALDEARKKTLKDCVLSIGPASFPGLDDSFVMDRASLERKQIASALIKPFVFGESVRDWSTVCELWALAPYDSQHRIVEFDAFASWCKHLWSYRTCLEGIVSFGGETRREQGDSWWSWYRWIPERYRSPLSISFAFVATHNHFVLDRGGKVFNRSAPIIKLSADASEDDHLKLLGLLNSSTACFWMKQTFHNKGGQGINEGAKAEHWEKFYEHTGTGLERFPIPASSPLSLARQLDALARQYGELLPESMVAAATPTAERLAEARSQAATIRGEMIALQEELDWQCYELYGLLSHGSTRKEHGKEYLDLELLSVFFRVDPWLKLGERAFEIAMARQMAKGELQTTWFERHGSTPIIELPTHWPDAYRKLVERRIKLIETIKEIGLIERPEYKRRWNAEPWEEQEQRALKNWLLDRLEDKRYWPRIELQSTAQLADRASADADFMQVAALYRGRADFDLAALVAELVEGEAVPFLPILRYKASGLRKREVWERTWEMQRAEDLATDQHGKNTEKDNKDKTQEEAPDSDLSSSVFLPCSSVANIPVPPKYTSADFQKTDYWRLRGKLDVPKERWISYPHCQNVSDPTLVVGWAGWNHLEQATALVTYYDARKREGWDAKRLMPLLAGLVQLLPWIHQWHPEIDKEFGETAGKSYQSMLEQDAHELGLTLEDIRTWQPPEKPRNTRTTRKKKGESS
jgi:hypothetical protein